VIYCLGLIYHLDVPDAFLLLDNMFEICDRLLIIDAFVSLEAALSVSYRDKTYEGERVREHEDQDSSATRARRLLRSIDNTFAFRFSKESLMRALHDAGFSSVFECTEPPEPTKPGNRTTVVALKDESVSVATYPWINDLNEAEIEEHIRSLEKDTL
jgi:hypothetical protein